MTTAAEQLQQFGLDVPMAQFFIFSSLDSPATIYSVVKNLGLTNAMVAEVIGVAGFAEAQVRLFFQTYGLDAAALDTVPGASAQFNAVATTLTAGADTRTGTSGADHFNGGAGNDTLSGVGANDKLLGADGNDVLDGGRGLDWLDGGNGNDLLTAGTHHTESSYSYYDSGSHSYVSGTNYAFDDVHAEFLFGGLGDDTLQGGYGSDFLDGGAGNDLLEGDHNAAAASNAGSTELRAMLNDTLYGGAGGDTLRGGNGNDVYLYNSLAQFGIDDVPAGETIADTGGTDTLRVLTSTNFSLLNGGTASLASMGLEQVLITSAETATFTAAQLEGTATKINATAALGAKVVVNGSSGSNNYSQLSLAAFGGNHAFDDNVDQIRFSLPSGTTAFTGTTGSDHIDAYTVTNVNAGSGNDTVAFDLGAEVRPGTVNGGAGTDTLVLWSGLAVNYSGAHLEVTNALLANVSHMEQLHLSSTKSATVTLGAQSNAAFASGIAIKTLLDVAGSVDSATGLTFGLQVQGSASTVAINVTGTKITDVLVGGSANDTLTGGLGTDYLSGGLGADTFVITPTVDGADVIYDFSAAQGDRLKVSEGIAFGGFFAQTGVATGSSFDTRNVFVFNSTPVSIEAAAAAIAADTSVNATHGIMVIKSSTTNQVEVYHSDNLNANGTETLVATLIGTDIATLDGNFLM